MISIVIPVYNVEEYLSECIESIINQTYRDIEIILVNDGSNDASGTICDKYAKKDDRIKVIHKENGGLSSARNAGIEIAKGEYLTFVDSDDYITNDMLEQLIYAMDDSVSISACKMCINENELQIGFSKNIKFYSKEEIISSILREKFVTTSANSKLYRRHLFDNIRYPEGLLYEDLGTTYKLIDLSDKIAFVNSQKYYYRYNINSITKSNFTNRQLDYYIIYEELQNFIKEKYPKFIKYVINHSVRISISFLRKISISSFDDKTTIDFLINKIKPNIFSYFFSGYSTFSKLYGLYVCVCPEKALKLFGKKRR